MLYSIQCSGCYIFNGEFKALPNRQAQCAAQLYNNKLSGTFSVHYHVSKNPSTDWYTEDQQMSVMC